jgi:hypothetical protein
MPHMNACDNTRLKTVIESSLTMQFPKVVQGVVQVPIFSSCGICFAPA